MSRVTTHEIQVVTPYRLDLTVSALRRMKTNLVDVYTSDNAKVACDGVPLAVFPSVEGFLGADDAVIHAACLSAGKLAELPG